ncbi:MAG: hypothetical protein QOF70_3242 [Acetobacteraceae bacterium]|jgi:hypothetical protein|nr:hypothetical protein [Acetobacteraceae bacterium]
MQHGDRLTQWRAVQQPASDRAGNEILDADHRQRGRTRSLAELEVNSDPALGATRADCKITETVDGRQGDDPLPLASCLSTVGRRTMSRRTILPLTFVDWLLIATATPALPGSGGAADPLSRAGVAETPALLCLVTRLLVAERRPTRLGPALSHPLPARGGSVCAHGWIWVDGGSPR